MISPTKVASHVLFAKPDTPLVVHRSPEFSDPTRPVHNAKLRELEGLCKFLAEHKITRMWWEEEDRTWVIAPENVAAFDNVQRWAVRLLVALDAGRA